MRTSKVALHGGGGAKVSSFYEDHWTEFTIVDVLIGLAESITLEPPGTAGHGFEFFIERPLGREWHQVKYQNAKLGKWTLPALKEEDVLKNFKTKLESDEDASCVFVSAHAAHPLGRLCDSAAESVSLDHFVSDFLSSGALMSEFIELHTTHWQIDEATAWRWLGKRLETRTIDDLTLEDRILDRAEAYFNEPAMKVSMALERVRKKILYRPASRSWILSQLNQLGVTLRDSSSPDDALKLLSDRFVASSRQTLVNGSYIARPATLEIERLLESRGVPAVVVTGVKGAGKSGILSEVVHNLTQRGTRVLSIDVTRLSSETTSTDVGTSLGLAASPVKSLARAAGSEEIVVVIDSLDSVAVSRDKPVALFGVVADVLRECGSYPNLKLLISCRTQDIDNDARIRALLRGPEPARRIDVGILDKDEVERAISDAGHDLSRLGATEMELLRVLANLRLFTQVPPVAMRRFSTEQELAGIFTEWIIHS